MISVNTREYESTIDDLAYIVGGEAALERAIRSFVDVTGRAPTGDELLDHLVDTRITELSDRIARRDQTAPRAGR
jgi:hypothetical protein